MELRYRRRIVDDELDELLPHIAAIALEGARGVGKTATALQRASTVFRLDDPAVRAVAEAGPEELLKADRPVLLDEWQRVPETWDCVRRAVDAGAPPGSFVLTGSANPTNPPTHSGAGRIVTIRMRPFALAERATEPTVSLRSLLDGSRPAILGTTSVALADYVDEIVSSGFPGLHHLRRRALRAQLDGYLDRIVDTDFEDLGHTVRRPQLLRRWMTAYAAASATTASYESIRDAATPGESEKPAKATTIPYRATLERLWIIEPLPAWVPTRNPLSRLTRMPRHHLVDPALAARLLGLGATALLTGKEPAQTVPRDGTLLGHLFEALITQSVRVYAQASEATVGHLRTASGQHEVDLIVSRDDHRVVAIEVKLSRSVVDRDVRHLRWLGERLGSDLLDAVVVTTGTHAYRRPDGIAVVPAALLGP